jgi:hypothetical protein
MEGSHRLDLSLQVLAGGGGQHRQSVSSSLAMPNNQLSPIEIYILDTEGTGLK